MQSRQEESAGIYLIYYLAVISVENVCQQTNFSCLVNDVNMTGLEEAAAWNLMARRHMTSNILAGP